MCYYYTYTLCRPNAVGNASSKRRRGTAHPVFTPCTWVKMTYYSEKSRRTIFFFPIPLRCRNHTIHRCRKHVYIFMYSKSPRLIGLNRPNTKYGPVGRDGSSCRSFFPVSPLPYKYIHYIYIYILCSKSCFYCTRIPLRRSLITHKNAHSASKLHVLDGAPIGIRNELATRLYNIYVYSAYLQSCMYYKLYQMIHLT